MAPGQRAFSSKALICLAELGRLAAATSLYCAHRAVLAWDGAYRADEPGADREVDVGKSDGERSRRAMAQLGS